MKVINDSLLAIPLHALHNAGNTKYLYMPLIDKKALSIILAESPKTGVKSDCSDTGIISFNPP
jgi:hypothetical protein